MKEPTLLMLLLVAASALIWAIETRQI